MPPLSLEDLIKAYQETDILLMPLIDATSNHAVLESIACGTPVMVNRVGGIGEYVDENCNFLMTGKNVDEWVSKIVELHEVRKRIPEMENDVRTAAQRFSADRVVQEYIDVYRKVSSL